MYPKPVISLKSQEYQKLKEQKEQEERERLALDALLLAMVCAVAYYACVTAGAL